MIQIYIAVDTHHRDTTLPKLRTWGELLHLHLLPEERERDDDVFINSKLSCVKRERENSLVGSFSKAVFHSPGSAIWGFAQIEKLLDRLSTGSSQHIETTFLTQTLCFQSTHWGSQHPDREFLLKEACSVYKSLRDLVRRFSAHLDRGFLKLQKLSARNWSKSRLGLYLPVSISRDNPVVCIYT